MIPHQLQLKNFLSYGPEPQTISFKNYHLICLSGKNGHGKSALLDAITWAIWGQARKTSGNSKADQGLLHLGQKHMFTILEFEVNGQQYRVRREYVHTKSKPFASLDFGIIQQDGKIIALSEKTIKATQEKIEKTIGITYDSFISSAFLRQGQSNEFSKKSPKERKEVLAEILHLQQFEEQKKIAAAQAKKLQQESNTLTSITERIERELEQLANNSEQLKLVKDKLSDLLKNKKALEKKQTTFLKNKSTFLQKIKESELLCQQRKETSRLLDQTKNEIKNKASVWHEIAKRQKKAFDKNNLVKKEKKLQQELLSFQKKLQKKLTYKDDYIKVREELTTLQTQLEKKHAQAEQKTKIDTVQIKEKIKQIDLQVQQEKKSIVVYEKELQEILAESLKRQKMLQKNSTVLKRYQEEENTFENVKFSYQQQCAQGTFLNRQIADIEKKTDQSRKQASCPLCQQKTDDNCSVIITTLTHEKQQLQNQLEQLKKEALSSKKQLSAMHKNLLETKKQHESSINLATKEEESAKNITKLEQEIQIKKDTIKLLDNEKQKLSSKLSELEQQQLQHNKNKQEIPTTPSCKKLQLQLDTIKKSVEQLEYRADKHKAIETELSIITQSLQEIQSLEEITQKQHERRQELFSLFKFAQNYTTQLEAINKKNALYNNVTTEYEATNNQEKQLILEQKQLEKEQQGLLIEKGSLEQKKELQKELQKELIKISKEKKATYQEMIDYQEIVKALGKDGIQALLIEQAIPEIEDEANEVLARLTNNQTQIFIESLRDLKKGGSKETLDIKISDSFGLRDYELFSGGEAFRIDFALRIGISKLLARKAGTTLQTIFIDEGFGSQDEEGLQLIMDNIYKIQDEFAKVIIVSHLPEMKEQFPVQFIVEKKRSGSCVSVIEQG